MHLMMLDGLDIAPSSHMHHPGSRNAAFSGGVSVKLDISGVPEHISLIFNRIGIAIFASTAKLTSLLAEVTRRSTLIEEA